MEGQFTGSTALIPPDRDGWEAIPRPVSVLIGKWRNRFFAFIFWSFAFMCKLCTILNLLVKISHIAFFISVTSATLVLIGLTGLFTEMVRQWDHHHTSYEFGVER